MRRGHSRGARIKLIAPSIMRRWLGQQGDVIYIYKGERNGSPSTDITTVLPINSNVQSTHPLAILCNVGISPGISEHHCHFPQTQIPSYKLAAGTITICFFFSFAITSTNWLHLFLMLF